MIQIDPAQRDALVAEFRSAPFGPHRPEMQKVLQRLRWGGGAGRPCVIVTVPYREWAIGIPSARRGDPVVVEPDPVFDNIGDAFGAVFERRLDALLESQRGLDEGPAMKGLR